MMCPHCGGQVAATQRVCSHCGAAVSSGDRDVTVATLTPPPVDVRKSDAAGAPSVRPAADTSPPEDPAIAATIPPPAPDAATIPPPAAEAATIPPPAPEDAATFVGGQATGGQGHPGPATGGQGPRSAVVTTLQPGTRFGRRYHLIRLLGEGGMGAVFQAWDEELAVVVAIKVIRPEALKDPAAARDLERRFKRELLLARNVTHKNVVRIHDLGEIDGVKYITMPYVHGGDLARLIGQEGRLPVPRALGIARQVAAGLVAAHEAGIVHRDLKPGNILLDEEDHALITDFGIARSVTGAGGGTIAGTIVGTLEYMAPEQAQGATVDHRADIYAFGLILMDMLVGRREAAHSATAMAELFARMSKAPPPVRTIDPSIPEAIDELIGRCVDPDPARRYQTTQELAADVEDLAGPRATTRTSRLTMPTPPAVPALPPPVHAPPTAVAAPPAAAAVRGRPWRAAAAIAVVLVLGAATFLLRDRLVGRPAETPAPVATRSVSLFIVPFRNASGDPSLDWLGPSLANMLRTEVGQSATFRTVPVDRVSQILTDLRIRQDENLDPAKLGQLAQFSSADTVLWGQYIKFGNEIRIDATLQDTKGERTVAVKAQASNDADLPDAIGRLASSVRENLALPPDAIKALAASALKPSSKSVQALRYYNEGSELARQGKQLEAVKKFEASGQEDPQFALAYSQLAQSYAALGETSNAERFSRRAVSLSDGLPTQERYLVLAAHARILNDRSKAIEYYANLDKQMPGNDDVLYELARLYEETGSFDAAREQYARLLKRDPKRLDALIGAGRVATTLGNAQNGLEYLNGALVLALQLENKEQEAAARRALGQAYEDTLNKPDEARAFYEASLAIERSLGRKAGIADSLYGIAGVDRGLGKVELALKGYDASLKTRREIGDREGVADVLASVGYLYDERGDYEKALKNYREALQVYREVGSKTHEAAVLNNVGQIYLNRGDFAEARTYFDQALALHEVIKVPGPKADTLHNLAVTAANSGEFDQAIARYLQALDLRRRAGDRRGTAVESYSLGVLYEYEGRYGAAVESHEEAVKILRETKESGFWLGAILGQYGSALSQAGRSADADKILNEALAAARQIGNHAVIAQNLNFQGDAFFYRGDWKQARTFYQQALHAATTASDRRFTLISRINLAKVATKEARPSEAVASFSQLSAEVDALGLRYLAVDSTIYLGEALLKKGDRDRARGVLEDALSRSERLGARALLARSHYLLAATLAQAGDEAESRRHDEQARRILQEIQQESKSEAVVKRADLAPVLQSPAH